MEAKFFDWESRPAVVMTEGFSVAVAVLYDGGDWERVLSVEVQDCGRVLSPRAFIKVFPGLPFIPSFEVVSTMTFLKQEPPTVADYSTDLLRELQKEPMPKWDYSKGPPSPAEQLQMEEDADLRRLAATERVFAARKARGWVRGRSTPMRGPRPK